MRWTSRIFLLLFISVAFLPGKSQKNEFEFRLEQIKQATQQNAHREAIALALDLVTSTARNNETSNLRIPQSILAVGEAYSAAGQYVEASKWFRKALAHHQRYEQGASPELAITYRAMAANYLASGQVELAQPYLEQSLDILSQAPEAYAVAYADALTERSTLHFFSKNWDDAASDLQTAMQIQEQALGLQSAPLARSLINLGGIYMQQGYFGKARGVYLHALNMQKAVLGSDDPEVATTLVNIAVYHDQMGEFAEAEGYLKQALELREAAFGPEHPLVGVVIDDLVSLHLSVGAPEKAMALLDQLKADRIGKLGGDDPGVAEVLDKYASLAITQGNPKQAEAYMQQALKIRQNYYGALHDRVAATLYNLGKLQNLLGKYEQARISLNSALDVYANQETESEAAMSALLAELIRTDLAQGQSALVEEHLLLLLGVKEAVYGMAHPEVVPVLQELVRFYEKEGKSELAATSRNRLVQIQNNY